MRKHWPIAFLVLFFAMMAGCSGCKKKDPTSGQQVGNSLYQLIPRDSQGVLTVQKVSAIPKQLGKMLTQYEGSDGQFRELLKGYGKVRTGINPLALKDLSKTGLDPNGALVASRTQVLGRNTVVLAAQLSDVSAFEKWIRQTAKSQMLAKSFRSATHGGHTIVTALGLSAKKKPIELLAYSIRGKHAVVSWERRSGQKKGSDHNQKVIQKLLGQKAKDSLQTDEGYHKVLKRLGKGTQVVFYVPKGAKVSKAEQQAQAAAVKKQLSSLKKRYPMVARLPLTRLLVLLQSNTAKGVSASLKLGSGGAQLRSIVPIPKVALAPIRSAVPKSGKSSELLKALTHKSILAIKTGVEPSILPMFMGQIAANFKLKPKQFLAFVKKHTGLDVEKDILAAGTGRVLLSLDRLNLRKIDTILGGNLRPLFSMFGFSVIAEVKDPKLLNKTLATLAKTFKNGGKAVTQVKKKGGRIQYMIPAWPGTVAHWTVKGNLFLYGLGEASLQNALDALADPKRRLYPDASKAGVMADQDSSALHLDIQGLSRALDTLPFFKLAAKKIFFSSYNLQNVKAIIGSLKAGDGFVQMQTSLQLKTASK